MLPATKINFFEDENDNFYRGYLPGYNDIVIDTYTVPRYFAELTFRVFILADSNSVDLAEKNKGSLDMVPAKFGDRNVVTFLALLGKCKKYVSKYGQYTHQTTGIWILSTNLAI